MTQDQQLESLVDNPHRACVEFRDDSGNELREPLDGLIALEKDGQRYNLWEYRPEIPPGVDGGCVFHVRAACPLTPATPGDPIQFVGTWTGVSRRVVWGEDGVNGTYRHIPGAPVSGARVTLTLLPD